MTGKDDNLAALLRETLTELGIPQHNASPDDASLAAKKYLQGAYNNAAREAMCNAALLFIGCNPTPEEAKKAFTAFFTQEVEILIAATLKLFDKDFDQDKNAYAALVSDIQKQSVVIKL